MPTSYSPIDEPSFTDTAFDAEEVLNGPASQPARPQTPSQPYSNDTAPTQAQPQAAPAAAPATSQTSSPAESAAPRRRPRAGIARTLQLVRDSRTVMFIGLVFTILAGYMLIVTISYFANIGSDQSAMLNGDFDPTMIRNAGGPFGAWIAHTLLYNWLGIGSFLLIYYLAVCGLSMLRVYRPPFWALTMRCLLTAVALSIVCGLVTYEFASPVYWGGRHGHLLNDRLITLTGIWGALGTSIIMGGLVIILYLTELKRIYGVASQGIRAYNERQAQRRAERERIREAEEAERLAREAAAEAERKAEETRQQAAMAAQRAQQQAESAETAQTERMTATAAPAATAISMGGPVATATAANVVPATDVRTENLFPEQTVANPDADVQDEAEEMEEIPVADYDDDDDDADDNTDNTPAEETQDETPLSPLFTGEDDEDFNRPLFSDSETDEAEDTEEAEEPLFATPAPAEADSRQTPPSAEAVLASEPYDPRAELSHFRFPTVDLLRPAKDNGPSVDVQEMEFNKRRLTETLRTFGVEISKIEATIGPTVTLYEIIPAEGVRTRSIRSLGEDLQLQLAAEGVRIIAPIPAKGTIGIEVPNKDPQVVSMRSVLDSEMYRNSKMELPMALGKTISNDIFMADLAKMPHLLVAGATGMGKSVGLNAIITSLLYKKHPSELKFVLIDPKRVELSLYRELERHYLASLPGEDAIITDMSKVVTVLNSLCIEMDNRLSLLEQAGARNIKEYNDKFVARKLNPEKHRFLPYIVLIIDEFADLIIRQGKEIENPVSRLAAVARAAGIHLIIATQRPTVNVITGGIKLNIPGRIAFRVIQGNDSRTILDQLGANQLIGRGDMLFSINGKLERVQCAFIDTPEVSAICENIGSQVGYQAPYELPEYSPEGEGGNISGANLGDRDPLFDECARLVVSTDTASTSSLQRRYSIGYNRAGKIMDQMEAAGIVGPSQGGKPRQVLVDPVTLEHILDNR
ncbi:MAG: DNA translocase FtsK [Duncaniella sp.]|uniref:FtsK/SpoIIIE family DNA translocase n=1 Tax=Duncaniella sp. TaxID=2518496 RepID=UPI0023CB129E|nr:DNA translocase FtsK [Duncaniella sp.]MDE5989711.1 DNA translocase FtsK [Duncaniella sp.]